MFPHRRLRGKPVSSHSDFLAYLKGKHPNMRQTELPFESGGGGARRTVLFMHPCDFELRCVPCSSQETPPPLATATEQPPEKLQQKNQKRHQKQGKLEVEHHQEQRAAEAPGEEAVQPRAKTGGITEAEGPL
jgi:hypothetical protein